MVLEIKRLVHEVYSSPEPEISVSDDSELAEMLYEGWQIVATDALSTTGAEDLAGYHIIILRRETD